MSFIEEARQATTALRAAILDLPFNRELAEGTLSPERFRHYLIQDALYLTEYARALSLLAAKAPLPAEIAQFNQAASGAILFEQAMQQSYLSHFGIETAEMRATEPTPTCLSYTSFMLAEAVTGSYQTLLAAVLPCFSIYAEVGSAIAATSRRDNPFQLWIDTYAAPEFQATVHAAEATAERAAALTTSEQRQRMLQLFCRSVEFEWLFWDAAYRLEAWPTAAWR
ncbi:MAG TPA: thiaminase II [Dongiaceae bacterium]